MNITKAFKKFEQFENIFKCPICGLEMQFRDRTSFVCEKNHCFDLSKYGYINFSPNQKRTLYTKELFESRRIIFESGFYDILTENIKQLINTYSDITSNSNALDIGCGEGFFISNIFGDGFLGNTFGMDIVKEAIVMGAKSNHDVKWLVGDLSKIPLKDETVDILLNIFTPANYSEFSRILKDDALLIKVIPSKNYLKELKYCIKNELKNKDYSNTEVLECFNNSMTCLERRHLTYEVPATQNQIENFIKMTPMMFNLDTSKIDTKNINQITIDVDVVAGRKN